MRTERFFGPTASASPRPSPLAHLVIWMGLLAFSLLVWGALMWLAHQVLMYLS